MSPERAAGVLLGEPVELEVRLGLDECGAAGALPLREDDGEGVRLRRTGGKPGAPALGIT
jgi:hypothetical protein